MKSFLIKYHNHFSAVLVLGIGAVTFYPNETANDNYIGAIIYRFSLHSVVYDHWQEPFWHTQTQISKMEKKKDTKLAWLLIIAVFIAAWLLRLYNASNA